MLGQRCVIGAGSVVRNSYLFDGVVVGPNCVIEYSIIGAGVQIHEMSRVERGCLIADRVTIGPQARLEAFQKLSRKSQGAHEEGEGEEGEEGEEGSDGEDEDEDEDEVDEADDEEEDDDEASVAEEDDSDYEEIEASECQLKNANDFIFMSCFRSGSRCARKTWAGI